MPRKVTVTVKAREDALEDLRYWAKKTPAERVDAVSLLRRQCLVFKGFRKLPRLRRTLRVLDRHE